MRVTRHRAQQLAPLSAADVLAGRIRRALYEISDAWDDTLEPARRAAGSHVLTSMVNPPLPISADVLDKRAKAHERLAWWALQVIHGRHLHRLVAIDVHALCAFLLIHVDWLADYPRALADLEGSAADLGAIAADNAPRHQTVGHCPGTNNGRPCVGIVVATIRRDDNKLPSEMACDATPRHAWPASEWRTLNRRLHADAGAARRLTIDRLGTMDMAGMMALAAAIDYDATHGKRGSA